MNDLKSTIKTWENYCSHLDDLVSFNHKDTKQNGTFKGINEKGHALIEIKNKLHTFPSLNLE